MFNMSREIRRFYLILHISPYEEIKRIKLYILVGSPEDSCPFSHFAGLTDRQLFRRQRHNLPFLARGAITESSRRDANKVIRNHRTRDGRWRVNRHDNGSHRRRFRYFQIDLHLSSDFRTTGVDWSSSFVVDSVQSSLTCFSNRARLNPRINSTSERIIYSTRVL